MHKQPLVETVRVLDLLTFEQLRHYVRCKHFSLES